MDYKQSTGIKALFLDRDGVININHGYVFQREKFDFINGIFELCIKARDAGYIIVVITNQSGIARNYYDRQAFNELTRWMEHQFWQKGIKIQHTFHCPHHPKFSKPCVCRKPKIGMITKATRRFGINLQESIMVGDSLSDMRCAQAANIKTRVYLNPNLANFKGNLHRPVDKPYFQVRNLKSINKLIA